METREKDMIKIINDLNRGKTRFPVEVTINATDGADPIDIVNCKNPDLLGIENTIDEEIKPVYGGYIDENLRAIENGREVQL